MKKTVLITGATSGFGQAMAEKFASAGFNLILNGRRKDRLIRLQQDIASQHDVQVHSLPFDVSDRDGVQEAIGSLSGRWRSIDILINNAGLALGRDYFDEAELDDWEVMIDTNVKGILYVTRAVLPLMKPAQGKHIVNIGSTAGKEVYEKGNVYCASKHAVGALSEAMRIDLLRHGFKVTAIHPGAAETEFSLVRFKGDQETAAKVYHGFKPLSAADVAEVAFFCCQLPAHVCVNDLVVTCTAQANNFYFFKEATQ